MTWSETAVLLLGQTLILHDFRIATELSVFLYTNLMLFASSRNVRRAVSDGSTSPRPPSRAHCLPRRQHDNVDSGGRLGRSGGLALIGHAAVSCVLVAVMTGCHSDSSADVAHWSGEITIDGQPLPDDATGTISFRPVGGGTAPAAGAPIENGRYDSPNTPKGSVMVYFDIQQPTGKSHYSERVGQEIQETKSIVPAEHGQGIQKEVTGDNLEADFDL